MTRSLTSMGRGWWNENLVSEAADAARVFDLVGYSLRGFDEAIRNALNQVPGDKSSLVDGHVQDMGVRYHNGRIEYRAEMRVAIRSHVPPSALEADAKGGLPSPLSNAPPFDPKRMRRVPFLA